MDSKILIDGPEEYCENKMLFKTIVCSHLSEKEFKYTQHEDHGLDFLLKYNKIEDEFLYTKKQLFREKKRDYFRKYVLKLRNKGFYIDVRMHDYLVFKDRIYVIKKGDNLLSKNNIRLVTKEIVDSKYAYKIFMTNFSVEYRWINPEKGYVTGKPGPFKIIFTKTYKDIAKKISVLAKCKGEKDAQCDTK
jgi:hypothetical protein